MFFDNCLSEIVLSLVDQDPDQWDSWPLSLEEFKSKYDTVSFHRSESVVVMTANKLISKQLVFDDEEQAAKFLEYCLL